jgi:lipoprotein-anchoring transpeptidase ErfK/SrfK
VESRGRHLARQSWWTRWWAIAAVVGLVAAGAAAGVVVANRGPSAAAVAAAKAKAAAARAASRAQAVHTAEVQLASTVSVSPASGATGVTLVAPVTVTTTSGTLTSVRVTDAAGTLLAGSLAASGLEWKSSSTLRPGTTYRVTVALTRPDGVSAQKVTTFTTLTPVALVTASVWPADGLSVGVGQPIVFTFDQDIASTAAQAAVLSHITVSMSTPVPGGWYWFSEHELHFRPKTFWPTDEQVSVSANLNGWNAGDGQWGSGTSPTRSAWARRASPSPTCRPRDDRHPQRENGATYPISGGRPEYPTMDGIHIVLDRESVVQMDSATVGIPVDSPNGYDETVYDDVHISDSGEYVHAAPWSVADQGAQRLARVYQREPRQRPGLFQLQSRRGHRRGCRQPPAATPGRPRGHGLVWSALEPVDAGHRAPAHLACRRGHWGGHCGWAPRPGR